MSTLRSLLLLAIASAPLAALADPFATRGAWDRSRPGGARVESLQDYSERRRLESRQELRALSRDADRRVEEAWLRRHGTPSDVAYYRQKIEAQDALDRLIAHQELDALEPGTGFERFQPETRRLLERSHIELRWIERRQDAELRLHELERDVAEDAPAGSPLRPGREFPAAP
jgi:hypothetical protein